MSTGTLYALGLGPGAPDLLTLRAQRLLHQCATVFVPVRHTGSRSFALDIAAPHIDPRRQQVETLPFPLPGEDWSQHVARMVASLPQGDAAFLTEGDPLFYSTFIGVLAVLRRTYPSVPVCIVPGVASPMAAAALAGIPLADDDQRVAVLPAMYALNDIPGVLRHFDTVVLLKVASVLDSVLDLVDEAGLGESVLHVRRIGAPGESVIAGSSAIRSAPAAVRSDYFSLVIVHGPATIPATSPRKG